MAGREVHQCGCADCASPDPNKIQLEHHQLNIILGRADEQQRRWIAGFESQRIGHGGDRYIAMVTGLCVDTIRRGREELANDLAGRPTDRTRLPGGGRTPVEKKRRN